LTQRWCIPNGKERRGEIATSHTAEDPAFKPQKLIKQRNESSSIETYYKKHYYSRVGHSHFGTVILANFITQICIKRATYI